MIYYRLSQDHEGLPEGATISEERYKKVGYLSRCYFDPLDEYELKDFIEYVNEGYCIENGIDKMLFYNKQELNNFLTKMNELATG